jgi:hypothetical protein
MLKGRSKKREKKGEGQNIKYICEKKIGVS